MNLYRQALYLEYFTLVYNIAEALASIGFGSLAGSIALIGFGLDSIIERLSGLVRIWRGITHGWVTITEGHRIHGIIKNVLTLVGISAGSHQLKITKEGYQDYTTSLTVIGGEKTSVIAYLVPTSIPTETPMNVPTFVPTTVPTTAPIVPDLYIKSKADLISHLMGDQFIYDHVGKPNI